VPPHLLNHSKQYLYPHDFGGWVEQPYLEKPLKFYESKGIAYEKRLDEWLEKIRGAKK
jgi:putative ATPase